MNTNKKFGKLDGEGNLIYVPKSFEHNGIHYNLTNRAQIYNEMGYYALVSTNPPEGELEPYWELEGNVLKEKWREAA